MSTEQENFALVVDRFEPDYKRLCLICRQTPCVTGVEDGKAVYQSEMCGPCTWGESSCIDPEEWNK